MNSKFFKTILLGMLLILCMSVTMATEVSEDTANEVAIPSENIDQTTLNTVDSDNSDQVTYTKKYTTKSNNTINLTEKSKNDNEITSSVNEKIITKNKKNNIKKEAQTITLNSNNFDEYVTDGKLNDNISEGDTVDIHGKLDSPKFALEINKPVNIISSTNDGYIDLDTQSTDTSGGYKNGIFQVTTGGSGTNITGITFHNTRIYIKDTSNVCVNNISCIVKNAVGMGVGSFSIRGGSDNITVKNSFFMNYANGGHSNVVVAGASNCLIENNTIQSDNTDGLTGNLLYLTTYYSNGISNHNITIRNNTIRTIGIDYATNYGLVLQGSGHIIEGNIIDNVAPVMAQYADADYGMETNIDEIIFNNNTILRGGPQLVFPGIVANNTFYGNALLKQVHAYNNTFNRVTIQNNVKFENNTAKEISITGKNNLLENNVVYSDEDYAVNIAGENNTLTNNKLLSVKGIGEETVNNTTSYVSIDNSEKLPKIFYINDDNIHQYFDDYDNNGMPAYLMKDNVFEDGDILVINLVQDNGLGNSFMDKIYLGRSDLVVDLIIENSTGTFVPDFGKGLTIKNSYIPTVVYCKDQITNTLTLINSTLGGAEYFRTLNKDEDSILISDYKYFLQNYLYLTVSHYIPVLDKDGYILNNVEPNSKIYVSKFVGYEDTYNYYGMSDLSLYRENIYINKPLNFVGFYELGNIASNVHLIEGSDTTTFKEITFDGDVIIESDSIKFENCTFNKNVILKGNVISFEGNIFNGDIDLDSISNVVFNSNIINSDSAINVVNSRNLGFENNTVTTTADNTIVFDEDSSNNVVRNNVLVADSLVGDDSVIAGENIVEDNTPSYDTQIVIDADSPAYADEELEVSISVNDLNNSKPVNKGYVEVYYDGYLIDIKDLTDGTTKVSIPVAEYIDGSDSYPIKVWYYDGKRYANNITTKSINVIKSDVSINIDEFTAKLNEKATITTTFLNSNGNPVQDTNVTFTIGRTTFTVETVDGIATLDEIVTKEWLDAGKVTVSFQSTDAYNSNTTTVTLNTTKDDVTVTPDVTVDGARADIKLTLTDSLGSPVTDGTVSIKTLDGSSELASGRVTSGVYTTTVTLPEDYAEEYLLASYTGSYYYNDFVRNVKITQMLNSTVTLETNSPLYGEELVINGKLVDSKNTPIGGANLTLNLNGSKVIVTTNDDGEYNYTYTPGLGVNSLTVTFDGTVDVYGSSASKDVTIRDTDREMNEVLNRLDDLQKENEKLQEQLEQLQEQNNKTSEQLEQLQEQNNKTSEQLDNITQANNELKEQLANQTANLTEQNKDLQGQLDNLTKDNNDLSEQLNDTKNNLTQQNKDLQEQLNNLTQQNKELQEQLKALEEQNNVTSEQNKELNDKLDSLVDLINQLNAPKDTVLTLDELDDAKYGDSITITGTLVDVGGNGVAGTVKLTINGGRATVTSDASGAFSYDYAVTRMGLNNITATYQGTDKYNPSNTTASVTVLEQDTSILLDDVVPIKSGERASITGQLVDANGNGVYGTVKLLINNGRATVKTDADGFFKYEASLSKVGVNNISLNYMGSAKYNACNATGTVDVTALDTIIVFDDIASVRSGESVSITGKLVDENGNPVVGTVKLLINNGRATVKTDASGVFSYATVLSKVGVNNITATYMGANRYTASESATAVEVTCMDTVLTLDSISDAKKGETITVSGKLVDANGGAVVGTVKLNINGARATVKTDSEGVFSYDYTVSKVGINNITASYLGANRYSASNTSTTVTVNRAGTRITLNMIDTVVQKANVNITGQLSDENDNGIYGTVKLLINNGRATVKTDSTGAFTYAFNATKLGENTIKASYLVSNNYEASETSAAFTVVKA